MVMVDASEQACFGRYGNFGPVSRRVARQAAQQESNFVVSVSADLMQGLICSRQHAIPSCAIVKKGHLVFQMIGLIPSRCLSMSGIGMVMRVRWTKG